MKRSRRRWTQRRGWGRDVLNGLSAIRGARRPSRLAPLRGSLSRKTFSRPPSFGRVTQPGRLSKTCSRRDAEDRNQDCTGGGEGRPHPSTDLSVRATVHVPRECARSATISSRTSPRSTASRRASNRGSAFNDGRQADLAFFIITHQRVLGTPSLLAREFEKRHGPARSA